MIPVISHTHVTIHLFLLYVLISGNYIGNILSCSFQKLIQTNMLYQHILAFCIFYLTISMTVNDSLNPMQSLLVSVISYIWFVITCKMNALYVSIVLFIIFITYMISNIIDYYQKEHESDRLKHTNYIVKSVGFIGAVLTTLVGFILYYRSKRREYSKNWSWSFFILGKPVCKNNK